MRSALAIIPTYNESENIAALVQAISARNPGIHVLIVDDNSPDGTAAAVKQLLSAQVHLLVRREGKGGRGSAVREGLRWGLASPHGFDWLLEMDGDFSHRPEDVVIGLAVAARQPTDRPVAVLGSRYLKASRILGWPVSRRLFSRVSNVLARILLGNLASDFTNGLRIYNRAAATLLSESPQRHQGYIYLSESLCLLARNDTLILSFPTLFHNRVRGESNTRLREIWQALYGIATIALDHRLRQMRLKT